MATLPTDAGGEATLLFHVFFKRHIRDTIGSSVILQIFQQHVLEGLAHHHNLDPMQRQACDREGRFRQCLLYRQEDLCVISSRAGAR